MSRPHYLQAVHEAELTRRTGSIRQFYGIALEADGPDCFLGECCEVFSSSHDEPVMAEVVGIRDGRVLLMPFGNLQGIRAGSEVVATGRSREVGVGQGLLGRVVDAFGNPLDDGGTLRLTGRYPVEGQPINPLKREPIETILETGVKAVDTALTLGRGQRIGIFAGSGVGKSTLLGMIARNMDADVNVIAMVGERGREVREFIEHALGAKGLARSVVVVATSDQPALVRSHAAFAATAIAEYFRDQGQDVVLTMDSLTRFAMARRELGLAVGEPPTSRGYTPSVFAVLPQLLERAGKIQDGGSITALYTVLVEGDDMNDPIADSVRAILDGNITLSRELANERHYPAIDLLQSNSRLLPALASNTELAEVDSLVRMLNLYEGAKDMVQVGAYRSGNQPELDRVLGRLPDIQALLRQPSEERIGREEAFEQLRGIVGKASP